MTREEALLWHRKLWYTIADLLSKPQTEYVHTIEIKNIALKKCKWKGEKPIAGCFCCEYDDQFNGDCSRCPVVWKGESYNACGNSEYADFKKALINKNFEEAVDIAFKIAELPERSFDE